MKTYSILAFHKDDGAEVKVISGERGISLQNVIGASWDPVKQEVSAATMNMDLNSEDARELAANLLKAADFADEAEKSSSRKRR